MPDDIAARITIAVETANATQQCDELEKALESINTAGATMITKTIR